MNSAQFHNALRVMRNIGENSLREFGVIDENWGEPEASDRDQLGDFFRDPYAEAIRMPDANFERLFALIESRQPPSWRGHQSAGQFLFLDGEDRSGECTP